ncbi:M16 family metallopeptidase [Speluncibacter jeojiensis]|uniref:M16 family metallopeptidase n=1 Tax=Speluncibacter jeojiensis TaxID=2710754 RepID=UPI0038CD47B4
MPRSPRLPLSKQSPAGRGPSAGLTGRGAPSATPGSASSKKAAVGNVVADGVRRTVLPGGLRVVTEFVPGVRSASVGVWVGVGSRDEGRSVAGAAHFLEHLLFKSTPTRTAVDIAQSVDSVGGELNAFTAKEHTCFYAHVLDEDLALAVDVVADVVLRGRCAGSDVEVERGVVLEEIAMRDDDPEDLLGDAFLTAMFGDHPVGRPVIGTVESIEAMTRSQLHSFHVRRYQPYRMVVAVAGNIEHEHVVELVRTAFGGHLEGDRLPAPRREGTARLRTAPTLAVLDRDGEQAHLSLGVRAFGRHDEQHRWALSVLNNALGGGLSSRLFQEIRESRGLAYSVYTGVDTYADTGVFSVYAGCQPENLGEVTELTLRVLADVAANGITEDECRRSKGALRGSLVLGLEDSGARMTRIGRSELSYGDHRSVTETLQRIDAVTVDEVRAVAAVLLNRPMGAAVVGPYARKRDLPRAVRSIVR